MTAQPSAPEFAVPLPTLDPMTKDISQRLPPELLTEILNHVSVPDVLRLKQVRRQPPAVHVYGRIN